MSEHPNVTVVNRMTKAVFENDRRGRTNAIGPVARVSKTVRRTN